MWATAGYPEITKRAPQRHQSDVVQPMLKVGEPDDQYEQEADRVADAVMRMPDSQVRRQPMEKEEEEKLKMQPVEDKEYLQMKCEKCEEEEKMRLKPAVQMQEGEAAYASPEIAQQIDATKGGGRSLPQNLQHEMSQKMGADFSRVNVHTDSNANQMNSALGARAFTHGTDIYFNSGEYKPDSSDGKHLLAHELTHTIQQSSGKMTPESDIQRYTVVSGEPYDRLSDDGKMAVEDHTRNAWAISSKIDESNKILNKINSKVEIKKLAAGEVNVKPPKNPKASSKKLKKFNIKDKGTGSEASLVDDCGTACLQILGAEHHGSWDFVAANKRGTTDEFTGSAEYKGDDNAAGGIVSTTEKLSGEIYKRIFRREFKRVFNRKEALKAWEKLSQKEKDRLSKKYGINQYAVPKVGQGITIGSERDMPGASETGYNFHFGFNLIASGHDYITLEDYDSSGVKYYFDMYGPTSKGQSWAEASSNVSALDDKTTTMVVQHSESLDGEINTDKIVFAPSPKAYVNKGSEKGRLSKGTKVRVIRKGINWMKVEVKSGKYDTQTGWILNKYFTNT